MGQMILERQREGTSAIRAGLRDSRPSLLTARPVGLAFDRVRTLVGDLEKLAFGKPPIQAEAAEEASGLLRGGVMRFVNCTKRADNRGRQCIDSSERPGSLHSWLDGSVVITRGSIEVVLRWHEFSSLVPAFPGIQPRDI